MIRSRWRALSVALLGMLLLTTSPGVEPASASGRIGADLRDGTVGMFVEVARSRHSTQRADGTRPPPPVRHQFIVVPACSANVDGPTSIDACPDLESQCLGDSFRVWVYESLLGTPVLGSGWTRAAERCSTADDPLGLIVVPTLTLAEVRRLPLPAGTSTVQPPGGRVLIHEPTNVYSTTAPIIMVTTIIGLPVQIRVTPTAYAWDFGDGTTIGPTPDPGGPYPTLTNAHTYTRPGTFSITMTTYYAAEYSVDNGEFEPITGQTSVTGTPVTVQVLAGGADLVAPTP